MRVQTTLDALRAIARHLMVRWPQDLIWISSSFPISITTMPRAHNLGFEGTANYTDAVASVTNALADAKVAVYPGQSFGCANAGFLRRSHRVTSSNYGRLRISEKTRSTAKMKRAFSAEQSMRKLPNKLEESGASTTTNLADCVKTAVTEGFPTMNLRIILTPRTGMESFTRL